MKEKLLISACLLGRNCKYSGGSNYHPLTAALRQRYELVPVCPECMGGLPIPHDPAERVGDKVLSRTGADVTAQFQRGAKLALRRAQQTGTALALLKERSPSCGYGAIYDGTFSGTVVPGSGVAAELLAKNGVTIYGESRIEELLKDAGKESFTLRRAHLGDETVLAFIQTEAWKAAFQDILSPEVLARYSDRGHAEDMYKTILYRELAQVTLASAAGQPCGIASWSQNRDDLGPEVAELICIHVLPGQWHKGCGSALMDHLLTEMRTSGYIQAALWVFSANTRAIGLYEKCGFTSTGKTRDIFGAEELLYIKML